MYAEHGEALEWDLVSCGIVGGEWDGDGCWFGAR